MYGGAAGGGQYNFPAPLCKLKNTLSGRATSPTSPKSPKDTAAAAGSIKDSAYSTSSSNGGDAGAEKGDVENPVAVPGKGVLSVTSSNGDGALSAELSAALATKDATSTPWWWAFLVLLKVGD